MVGNPEDRFSHNEARIALEGVQLICVFVVHIHKNQVFFNVTHRYDLLYDITNDFSCA